MCQDKKFDYILARSRARETSILAFASIAAGASLVLLGLYMQAEIATTADLQNANTTAEQKARTEKFDNYKQGIQAMGILFAFLGLLYREVTALTIHKADEDYLRNEAKIKHDEGKAHTYDTRRAIIIRLLLFLPIMAWSYLIFQSINAVYLACIVIGVYIVYVWLVFERKDCNSKSA